MRFYNHNQQKTMKKIICLLSLLFLFSPFISGQWDGVVSLDVDLSTLSNKTFDSRIKVIPRMIINNTILNVSCASNNYVQIVVTDKGTNAEVQICGDTLNINYDAGKLVITNGAGNNLNIFQKDTTLDYNFNFVISPDILNVYYDALVLLKGSATQKDIIYKKYKLSQTTDTTFFSANVMSDLSNRQVERGTTTATFAASSAKGINVTKLADGFAKFLASRFKKELTISFFNRFKDKLNSDKLRDLRTLFKNTSGELNLIDDKFTHYEAYLSALRQSMEIDCHQLPEQFKKLVEDPNSQVSDALANKPNFQYVLDNVLTFGIEIRDSVHIGKALANLDLAKSVNFNPVDKNLMGAFETVQLVSESLRNIQTGPNHSYWISDSQIKGLMQDEVLLNLFLGLFAEKSKLDNIYLSSNSLFIILTSKTPEEVKTLVESMISSIKSIENIHSSTKGTVTNQEKDYVALQYFDAASALINTSNHLAPLLKPSEANTLKKYNTFGTNVIDMTRSFVTQNYSIGLLYLSRVLTEIDSSSSALQKINTVLGNQGLFIAQMAESENSEDVAAILENFAAPTGSWRDKRTAEWNIAIDSYVGPAYYSVQDNDSRLGFSTPVGASITFPFNHVTLFVSAFDLGPLTSFRLTNDTSQIANVYLKEILSPGAFLSINFGDNYPITINGGYQRFPLLEKVGTTENDVNLNRKGGFSGSIVVNIPLFTLYNDPKNR